MDLSSDSDSEPDLPDAEPYAPHSKPHISHRTQQHLQDIRHVLWDWCVKTQCHDFPHSMFTTTTILPDPVLTTIASNRQLKMSDDLQLSLPTSWAFIERYGQQVLNLVAKLDANDHAHWEAKKVADQAPRKQESEQKVLDRAAKENINILGTGCFNTQDLLSAVDQQPPVPDNM
ncbi:hypothetical protein HD554DRAFT_2176944 [Boletus coccyginus]|nr:hypothetical protein HD554DRAFT_2176944 [Boletus coccyginus]